MKKSRFIQILEALLMMLVTYPIMEALLIVITPVWTITYALTNNIFDIDILDNIKRAWRLITVVFAKAYKEVFIYDLLGKERQCHNRNL